MTRERARQRARLWERARQRAHLWERARQRARRALDRAGGVVLPPLAIFVLSALTSWGLLRGDDSADARVPEAAPPAVFAPAIEIGAVSALPIEEVTASEPTTADTPEVFGPMLAFSAGSDAAADGDVPELADDAIRVITGKIPKGGSIATALGAEGVEPARVYEISVAMKPVFDFRRVQAGDFFALIADARGRVLSFEFQRGRSTVYRLERDAVGQLSAHEDDVPTERRVLQLAGIVETSLFEAMTGQGEGAELVQLFADIFVWDIDFSTQTRPGDEFRLVYEKHYDPKGFVHYGNILAAEYSTPNRENQAYYFEDEDGYGDYFDADGKSLRRAFLRAPVNYSRISSRYTKSRLHPILKVRRPHEGIDYAAPTGTPVWAVADGEVIFAGWSGGFGRLVKIRHNNGFVSYYGHLSRYGDSLQKGTRVRQKRVIGYVGSSGMSTGPHLDYRLRTNGRFVDPLKVKFPSGEPVSVRKLARFNEIKAKRASELRSTNPPLVLEAAM